MGTKDVGCGMEASREIKDCLFLLAVIVCGSCRNSACSSWRKGWVGDGWGMYEAMNGRLEGGLRSRGN